MISFKMIKKGFFRCLCSPDYSRSLREWEIPDDYKSVMVLPLLKKGNCDLPKKKQKKNQPVSLLSSAGKNNGANCFQTHNMIFMYKNNLIYKTSLAFCLNILLHFNYLTFFI